MTPVWLEAGRREIFRALTPDLAFANWRVAMVNMNIDYLDQIYFQADVEVRTWVERLGTKSFTLYEEIWQGDRRCVEGRATYVCYDYSEERSIPVPAAARAFFETLQRDAQD